MYLSRICMFQWLQAAAAQLIEKTKAHELYNADSDAENSISKGDAVLSNDGLTAPPPDAGSSPEDNSTLDPAFFPPPAPTTEESYFNLQPSRNLDTSAVSPPATDDSAPITATQMDGNDGEPPVVAGGQLNDQPILTNSGALLQNQQAAASNGVIQQQPSVPSSSSRRNRNRWAFPMFSQSALPESQAAGSSPGIWYLRYFVCSIRALLFLLHHMVSFRFPKTYKV